MTLRPPKFTIKPKHYTFILDHYPSYLSSLMFLGEHLKAWVGISPPAWHSPDEQWPSFPNQSESQALPKPQTDPCSNSQPSFTPWMLFFISSIKMFGETLGTHTCSICRSITFLGLCATLPRGWTQPWRVIMPWCYVSGCFTCKQMGWGEPDPGVFCHLLNDTALIGLCSQPVKQRRLLARSHRDQRCQQPSQPEPGQEPPTAPLGSFPLLTLPCST